MNRKSFSENLKFYRKKLGLSQKEVAEKLFITSKAVSKWENAISEPCVEMIQKLANIFNINVNCFFEEKNNDENKVYKIVVTGGPCSGKTTAMSLIQNTFIKLGYNVIIIPETATELILGGIAPWSINNNINFQSFVLSLQLEKEKIFEQAINNLKNKNKVLLVCDRGALDGKAYLKNNYEFEQILKKFNLNEINLRDNYNAVFHLVTAAKGAEEFYGYNNKARYESVEEAIIKDEKTLNSWVGHPHLRVIDNSTDFDNKMKRLINEIELFLGEPEPYEIEKKFLIEMPDVKKLEKMENCKKVEIVQTYLKNSKENEEVRIRQRGYNGNFIYTKTIKRKINNIKRFETETRITKDEYLQLLLEADTNKHQIRKTRYCLTYKNQYLEIDLFKDLLNEAILEIELNTEEQKIELPKFLKIIKEVTGDEKYYNHNLAIR